MKNLRSKDYKMKRSKVFLLMILPLMILSLITGCGGTQQSGVDKPDNNFSGTEVKLGMITPLNSTEEKMGNILGGIEEAAGSKSKHLPKFYDNLRAMQMAVESGEIEEISVYKSVADYIVANNDKFEIVPDNALEKIAYSFCFAVRKDEPQLKVNLDTVISEMKADGTLDKLINDYITNVEKGKTPPKVEIPRTEGAETIKVGITGDLPPLDLVLPDNSPAGFNTAMLAEIAKRLGRNIEPVQIESGSRAAALSSKIIDVVFWAIVPLGKELPIDLDKPEGLELSSPYFKDNVAHIRFKNNK